MDKTKNIKLKCLYSNNNSNRCVNNKVYSQNDKELGKIKDFTLSRVHSVPSLWTITRQLRFVKCRNLPPETMWKAATLLQFQRENKGDGGEGKVLFSLKYVEKVKSKGVVGDRNGQRRDDGSPCGQDLSLLVRSVTHTYTE